MQAYSSSNQEVKPTCPPLNLQWLYGSIWPTKHGRTDAVLFWVWASRGLKVFAFAYFTYLLFCCVVCRILVPWLREGNGNPLQYSCLENPMDRGAWWAAVHGVARSQTQLSNFTFTFHFHALEKEMATHFSVLAWRIPRTGEPGGLLSMGSHTVEHNWSDLAAVPWLKIEPGPWQWKHRALSPGLPGNSHTFAFLKKYSCHARFIWQHIS